MPQFFISRPVFAWVIAILITLGGVFSILNLPVEAYPEVAPVQVSVSATYPGANADTVEKAVTQVIEQQLTGIDNLLYFSASSNSSGGATITLTFESGTDADIAAVQTQNRVSLAEPRLPTEVIQQGISVSKSSESLLMAIAIRSEDGRYDSHELNNILSTQVLDHIQRVPGVGSINQFGSEYAMRVWLNPDKLHAYNMSASTVLDTIREQNIQVGAGAIGADPAVPGQQFTASVTTEGRFTQPEQFENIILRAESGGATVRLKDVATVMLGPARYSLDTRVSEPGSDPQPIAAFGILLAPGADALEVRKLLEARMNELKTSFPQNVTWFVPFDTTTFINIAIEEVVITLLEAIALVFVVMLLFLQSFRATIIPTLVVPVALMGAFIGMYLTGFTINQLSLFGMVLAIGIVVDDAIVVIEAVERIMRDEHLAPREATRKAMGQITSAIVTITIVLAAVFIPSALQSGSVGAIYKQFALTIAISMGFSALLALTFTPALCATLLRPTHLKPNVIFRWFNKGYDRLQNAYVKRVYMSVTHLPRWIAGFAVLLVLAGFLFMRLPGGFVPEEDQGYAIILVQLPPGSTIERTKNVMTHASQILQQNEATERVMLVTGFSFLGSGENVGLAFVKLKHWDERAVTAPEYIQWANGALYMGIKEGQAFAVNLPTIRGLGQFGGFDLYLEDRAGRGYDALVAARTTLIEKAAANSVLEGVRPNTVPDAPRLDMTVDRVQAQSMGLSVADVYTAIQLMLAPVYANDFLYEGRIMRVMLQADAPFRAGPESLSRFYVPKSDTDTNTATDASSTDMIPLSSVVRTQWTVAPTGITRFNGFPAVQITGGNKPGFSSGDAMEEMGKLIRTELPPGFSFDWAGQSLQEILAGSEAPMLFALSLLVVFLCLAALYESWAIPVSVMLAVPIGVLGAALFVMLRGLPNDVFFKVGLITIIGLSAKNAILIVEFAVEQQQAGKSLHDAVLEAARLRLRPILMTSFAFILGVMPLVISTGAGANARHAIGTGVVGGMLTATLLGVLFIPVFYVAIKRLTGDKLDETDEEKKIAG